MEFEDYYEDYWEEPEEERPRDKKIDEAKGKLGVFFKERKEEVFFKRQVQVLFEKDFYHWITYYALKELEAEGLINTYPMPLIGATRIKFVFHRGKRFYKRECEKKAKVVRKYSEPVMAKAFGDYAELIWREAFLREGFKLECKDCNEYRSRKWKKTGHNLDFIISRDGVSYGCEVKNTLQYISRYELETKVAMCEYLEIKPVFIMRMSPRNYNYEEIITKGGFVRNFKDEIYPPGQQELVREIKEVFDLPVKVYPEIEDGRLALFLKWHEENVK